MIIVDFVKNHKPKEIFAKASKTIFVKKLRGAMMSGLQSASSQIKNAKIINLSNKTKECNIWFFPRFCKFSKVSFY